MKTIRVLVVDDSNFLRRTLPRLLEMDPAIKVVGAAENGEQALTMVKELRPDVVTLDIQMPVMDGLTALRHIMRETPTRVVMLSSFTAPGAKETLEALQIGAIDFVLKPSGPTSLDIETIRTELVAKIYLAAHSNIPTNTSGADFLNKFRSLVNDLVKRRETTEWTPPAKVPHQRRLVAIASSTGGPAALQLLLPALPADLNAGIVIVQHIANEFTTLLAEQLGRMASIKVREAHEGDVITAGLVLVAPSGAHTRIVREGTQLVVRLTPEPSSALHRPSADVLFHSIATACPTEAVGIILTGMGEDGALGLKALHEAGGHTIAQDEATALIYGMPRKAVELGAVDVSLPLEKIAAQIVSLTAKGH
jgi:two-component system chemotaxis response regulator CheB